MANKLYEESHIQDIANAIREKNGNSNTYTVAQMGDAIRNIPSGECEHNMKVYTGTITENIIGSQVHATLLKNDFLKEHRNDANLFVRVEFDVGSTAYTIIKTWGFNAVGIFPSDTTVMKQYCMRYAADGTTKNVVEMEEPLNTDSTTKVGALQITEEGELRIYSNSASNYAIRPSNYTVTVEW